MNKNGKINGLFLNSTALIHDSAMKCALGLVLGCHVKSLIFMYRDKDYYPFTALIF